MFHGSFAVQSQVFYLILHFCELIDGGHQFQMAHPIADCMSMLLSENDAGVRDAC